MLGIPFQLLNVVAALAALPAQVLRLAVRPRAILLQAARHPAAPVLHQALVAAVPVMGLPSGMPLRSTLVVSKWYTTV